VIFQIKSSITDPEALFLYNQADWSSDPSAFFLSSPLSTTCDWEGGAVEEKKVLPRIRRIKRRT
jgi:hypothetical protein